MTTLAEHMIVAGAENRPPMLDKTMYNSWQSHTLLYIKGKKNGRIILKSIENGLLIYLTIDENGQIRNKKYVELTEQEKFQDDCDVQALNIALQVKITLHTPDVLKAKLSSYDQDVSLRYMQQTQNAIVQDANSSAQQNSMIVSMFEQMSEQMSNQVTHWDKVNQENKTVNESLTAELERYKEPSKLNDNLEIKRLEQENDHLFELLLSQDIVYICVNSLASRNEHCEMQQSFINEYNENLVLKAELAKKKHMVEKKFFDEVELRENTFSGSDNEDANEHIEKVLEIVDLFHVPNITEVILFYNGLDVLTRQILDSRGRSTKNSDGLAAIQAQMNNLGREIKKVNEKVYVAQVRCEQCKGPHYPKDCLLKEGWKTLEEAYYTQFGGPFQGGGYRATAPGYYQRNNTNPSYQEQRQSMEDTLSKFMSGSAKRHEENSNLIKEI
ncbi:hypothetical protein Tco_0666436 [Tanacetum coccineum]